MNRKGQRDPPDQPHGFSGGFISEVGLNCPCGQEYNPLMFDTGRLTQLKYQSGYLDTPVHNESIVAGAFSDIQQLAVVSNHDLHADLVPSCNMPLPHPSISIWIS